MDPATLIGQPILIVAIVAVTVTYAGAVAWMTYAIYHTTPELLQVQLFRKMRTLQNSVLFMGLGLVVGMALLTVFMADLVLPDPVWAAGGLAAAGLFWYGLITYSRVFRIPRDRPAQR